MRETKALSGYGTGQTRNKGAVTPTHTSSRRLRSSRSNLAKGQFFLMIDNRSSITDITLRLERKTGGQLKEVNLNMRKKRSAGVFDPPPGEYLLTEANHPEWVCHITISPQ
ncbi:MAG: hypothetical protein ACREBG_29635 [Pyrinomonadaceae bacterium]